MNKSAARRVIFYNPHTSGFLFEGSGARPGSKIKPVGQYSHNSPSEHVWHLVDGFYSSYLNFRFFHVLPKPIRVLIALIEHSLFFRFKKSAITSNQLNENDVLVVALHQFFNFHQNHDNATIRQFRKPNTILVRFSHVHRDLQNSLEFLHQLGNVTLLTDHAFAPGYNDRYRLLKKFKVFASPFFVEQRYFDEDPPTENRKLLLVATGSFHELAPSPELKHILEITQNSSIHFTRPNISKLLASGTRSENVISIHRRVDGSQDKDYHQHDFPALYKNSLFGIPGEEGVGVISRNALEMMASGCIVLSEHPEIYIAAGFKENEDFLTLDFNLKKDELLEKLKKIESQESELLREVRKNAYSKVKARYSFEVLRQEWNNFLYDDG